MFIPFFFRKPPVYQHKECKLLDVETGKCTRRNVIVQRNEFSCKHFDKLDASSTFEKFRCTHNSCDWQRPIELAFNEYYISEEDTTVEVGFFRCEICGEITALHQFGGQSLIKVQNGEDINDPQWLGAKISEHL